MPQAATLRSPHMEACITSTFLVVGVNYILLQAGPSNMIQAALTLIFISEIDDEVCKSLGIWTMEDTWNSKCQSCLLQPVRLTKKNEDSNTNNCWMMFKMMMLLPIFVAVLCSMIYGLQQGYC